MSLSTFNDRAENTHSVEFEAPNSAEVQPVNTRKHFSIDLSLELEHQLNMESPPVTPAHFPVTATEDLKERHEALDAEVLAHLVSQLRHSLAEMTKERDGLAKMLAESHSKQASLNDALQHMTEKSTELGEQLDEARKKMKDDEEAIILLRAKVEESRRGLMRLQTEHKRQSMGPIDVNRASLMLTSPPMTANKRASFTPLTGRSTNSHRRVSSVSDIGLTMANADLASSPNAQVITFPDSASSNPPPSSARFPGLFNGRPQPDLMVDVPLSNGEVHDLELKESVQRLKDELATVRHELIEATEARQASETCVEALRRFIAENNFSNGESSVPNAIKLPPPPTMTTGEEEDSTKKRAGNGTMGWGFKLWGGDSQAAPHSAPLGGPRTAGGIAAAPSGPPGAPLSRKLGGFFSSSRTASISSIQSATLPPLQTNASSMHRNFSHGSNSDTSSVTEPLSPGDDIHGLGGRVMVRDGSYLSESGSVLEIKNLDLEYVR